MAYKKYREMKVYEASGYQYKRTPSIVLKGKWLSDLGFDIGEQIEVKCEDGRLVITKANEIWDINQLMSGLMWILGRVEERGWIYKTLIIRMISVALYFSEEIFVNCISCYWMNSDFVFGEFIDKFFAV